MTEAERALWQRLRQPPFKAYHFRRQATIGRYFCDFASHSLKMVVEVDGGQHAENAADDRRTAYLNSEGYRVLRFWNHKVLKNLSGVLIAIDTAIDTGIADRPPHPRPRPAASAGRGVE
jgi:very-short-patch-repair endonuclease